jgi:tRNA A37 threonylcarbamoyltransferase TsaD
MMELNFEGMKRILTATTETSKQEEVNKEKREQLAKRLKEDDFDDLMQFTEASVRIIYFIFKYFIKV